MSHTKQTVLLALKILLGVSFVGAGLNHFRDPAFYLRMMPAYLPAHDLLVQLSGVTEIASGLVLLVPRISVWGARAIVAHLVVFLSVHIGMVQHAHDRYSDLPLAALWLRIGVQLVLIAWAALFIRDNKPPPA